MAKRKSYRHHGNYRFTPSRKAALRRAALISAKKRRNHRIKVAAGVVGALAGAGAAAYAGHRYGSSAVAGVSSFKPKMAAARNNLAVRLASSPQIKESVRVKSAVSVAHPSKTTVSAPITANDRARAQATRQKLAQGQLPPHMGGPDKRKYNEDDSVNTEAMTNRSVRATLKRSRKKTQGRKTTSLVPAAKKVKRPTGYKGPTVDQIFAQWIKDFEPSNG